MNHLVAPTHFVETFDAHGNRTVELRTYPVQARRTVSPKPKATAKKPKPRVVTARVVTNKAVVAPATPVQPPTAKVEQHVTTVVIARVVETPAVEYAPTLRLVPTVPVLTGSLENYRGGRSRRGHKSWRNYGRKPRMAHRVTQIPGDQWVPTYVPIGY